MLEKIEDAFLDIKAETIEHVKVEFLLKQV